MPSLEPYEKGYITNEELKWKRMWRTLLDFRIADEKLCEGNERLNFWRYFLQKRKCLSTLLKYSIIWSKKNIQYILLQTDLKKPNGAN